MFYSSEPEALREFIRDKLGFLATDVGGGWLIFAFPEADMGVHPAKSEEPKTASTHDSSFCCDDLPATVAELKARGVEFFDDVVDEGFGLVTHYRMPGGVTVQLYEPAYER